MTFGQTSKVLFLGALHLRSLSLLSVETIAEVSPWGIIILLQRHNVLPTIRHLATTAHKRSPGIRIAIICSAWWSVWQFMLHKLILFVVLPSLSTWIFFACCSIKSLLTKTYFISHTVRFVHVVEILNQYINLGHSMYCNRYDIRVGEGGRK